MIEAFTSTLFMIFVASDFRQSCFPLRTFSTTVSDWVVLVLISPGQPSLLIRLKNLRLHLRLINFISLNLATDFHRMVW